jgi:hypothetical protein
LGVPLTLPVEDAGVVFLAAVFCLSFLFFCLSLPVDLSVFTCFLSSFFVCVEALLALSDFFLLLSFAKAFFRALRVSLILFHLGRLFGRAWFFLKCLQLEGFVQILTLTTLHMRLKESSFS